MITFMTWVGVGAAAVAYWVLGAIWYSPIGFGKLWIKLSKVKPNPEYMMGVMIKGFILSLIGAAGLMCFQYRLGITDPVQGILLGLTAWVGLVFPVRAQALVYEDYSLDLFCLNAGYNIVGFMLMGLILSFYV